MKGPPEMCEPQVNAQDATSAGSNSYRSNQGVDFSDYMWMGEEEIGDFDKKCEDEFWEDFLIQNAYEEMLADEEDKYLEQFSGTTSEPTGRGGGREMGDGPHIGQGVGRGGGRSNPRQPQSHQPQQQQLLEIERHMADLNVNSNNVHYQGHYPNSQQRPRMHLPHFQQQRQQQPRQRHAPSTHQSYQQPHNNQQHQVNPQQYQAHYSSPRHQIPPNYRQIPPPPIHSQQQQPRMQSRGHANHGHHQQPPQGDISAIPSHHVFGSSSGRSGAGSRNQQAHGAASNNIASASALSSGVGGSFSSSSAASFALNRLNPNAQEFVPGMGFSAPPLHMVSVNDLSDR